MSPGASSGGSCLMTDARQAVTATLSDQVLTSTSRRRPVCVRQLPQPRTFLAPPVNDNRKLHTFAWPGGRAASACGTLPLTGSARNERLSNGLRPAPARTPAPATRPRLAPSKGEDDRSATKPLRSTSNATTDSSRSSPPASMPDAKQSCQIDDGIIKLTKTVHSSSIIACSHDT